MVRKAMTLTGIAALAVALTAGGAIAAPGGQGKSKGKKIGHITAKACNTERKAAGKEAFESVYGKPAMRNCMADKRPEAKKAVKKGKKAKSLVDKQIVNAAKACKAERSDPNFAATHDGKTFDEFYGTNRNLKNAYGKCVSSKAKAQEAPAPTA